MGKYDQTMSLVDYIQLIHKPLPLVKKMVSKQINVYLNYFRELARLIVRKMGKRAYVILLSIFILISAFFLKRLVQRKMATKILRPLVAM
mmetsp:Transcript_14011/g.23801  ORF Transcript_14011/g.23801 Transcript_14011/m.23801 type:complete len:90 (-) Transcript_14011:100-369(-)